MTAEVGEVVAIQYDADWPVSIGDVLRTPSGRTYVVVSVRVQERGIHAGRQHLRAAVVEGEISASATIHELNWYPRRRRRP